MSNSELQVLAFNKTSAIFIYDGRYPGPSKDKITGYSCTRKNWKYYNRRHVDNRVSDYPDGDLRDEIVREYESWLKTDDGISYIEKSIGWREERLNRLIEKHSQWFVGQGIQPPDVVRESGRKRRLTHCYACKEEDGTFHHLDNAVRPECTRCGWIICECGACGCQYY